jgi:hypothetical protein
MNREAVSRLLFPIPTIALIGILLATLLSSMLHEEERKRGLHRQTREATCRAEVGALLGPLGRGVVARRLGPRFCEGVHDRVFDDFE